jgi:radical SAM protein with 4Fe4S-binding SPASM domain
MPNTIHREYITADARELPRLPYYFLSGIKYHAAGLLYTPKPLYATLHLTKKCNSRCVMCLDWRTPPDEKELTREEITKIFKNPLFSSVEKFALTGGEPTLREDLVEIAETVLDSCPGIKELALLTNGLETSSVIKKAVELMKLPKLAGSNKLTIQVSLDGYGEVHEKVRRVPDAFHKASETIKLLKSLKSQTPFNLCITCVVQPFNLDNLVQMAKFGQDIGVAINFIPVDLILLSSNHKAEVSNDAISLQMSPDQFKQLNKLLDNEIKPYLKPSNLPFWKEFLRINEGKKRRLPCFILRHYAGIQSDGKMYFCARATAPHTLGDLRVESPDRIWFSARASQMRNNVENEICQTCTSMCDTAFALRHEFFYYSRFMLVTNTRYLFGNINSSKKSMPNLIY